MIIKTVIHIIFCLIFHKGDVFKIYKQFYQDSGHKTISNIFSQKNQCKFEEMRGYILYPNIVYDAKEKEKRSKKSSQEKCYTFIVEIK